MGRASADAEPSARDERRPVAREIRSEMRASTLPRLLLDSPRWRGTTATEADAAASSPTESPDVGSARRVSAQI